MRYSVLLFCVLSVVAASNVELTGNYHLDVGIPLATEIKAGEDEILASQSRNGSRVAGGWEAAPNSHPYLAGLIITFITHPGITSVCGSTLLSSNRLVTAAHCWWHGGFIGRELTVVLGSHFLFTGGTRIPTSNVVMHPGWNPTITILLNDIAIIYIATPIPRAQIQPVNLPHNNLWNTFQGHIAIAAGYGKTSDSQVNIPWSTFVTEMHVPVISVAQCQSVFGNQVGPTTLCTSGAGRRGLCPGDFGGPLVIRQNGQNILIGIGSFRAKAGCQLGFPSGFTRVTSFYHFILYHLSDM